VSTKITILSENYTIGILGLRGEHGFSALIEKDGKQFLYDTGQLGICVDNAAVLKKDLTKTDKILLSHGHVDHTGGLQRALEAIGRPVEIIAHPDIFGKKYAVDKENGKVYIGIPFEKKYLENKFKASFNFQKAFYKVDEDVWLTGEIPFSNILEKIPDQFQAEADGRMKKDTFTDDNALVIDAKKGLVVVLGCGHRGAVNTLEYIKQKLGKNIYAVIGGIHLNGADRAHIDFVKSSLKQIFKEENTGIFACGHCTGVKIVNEFWPEFKGILSYASCGITLEF